MRYGKGSFSRFFMYSSQTIFAPLSVYDVTASHGCTVGSLNQTELFYLKSRGLSEADARAFLQYAFAEKIVEEIEDPEIRYLVETQLLGELTHGELIAELKESVDV